MTGSSLLGRSLALCRAAIAAGVVFDQAQNMARHQRRHALADADVGIQLVQRLGARFVQQAFGQSARAASGSRFSAVSACASRSLAELDRFVQVDGAQMMPDRRARLAGAHETSARSGSGARSATVMISTMSPLRSSVRSGACSWLILTATVWSPMSVWIV